MYTPTGLPGSGGQLERITAGDTPQSSCSLSNGLDCEMWGHRWRDGWDVSALASWDPSLHSIICVVFMTCYSMWCRLYYIMTWFWCVKSISAVAGSMETVGVKSFKLFWETSPALSPPSLDFWSDMLFTFASYKRFKPTLRKNRLLYTCFGTVPVVLELSKASLKLRLHKKWMYQLISKQNSTTHQRLWWHHVLKSSKSSNNSS